MSYFQGGGKPRFTRVGFLRDLALQADGKVYESTLLFWLPWGLRKEMLQKTYPCKLAHPPTQPEDAHNESGTWYAHIPGASVTASPLEASLSIRIIPDNSQDRSPPNNNRQVHSLRIWIDGEGGLNQAPPIAVAVKDRATVDAFYNAALTAGNKDNGASGVRARYHPNYYGASVLDPDGHNIEAVCHAAE